MNIVEWRFGNVIVSCGLVSMAVGIVGLLMTSNHLFNIPIGLGLVIILLRQLVM